MKKYDGWHEFDYYKQIENRVVSLQNTLEYTYSSRQFWLKAFWLQAITFWLILLLH